MHHVKGLEIYSCRYSSFEHHTGDSTIWLGSTPILRENTLGVIKDSHLSSPSTNTSPEVLWLDGYLEYSHAAMDFPGLSGKISSSRGGREHIIRIHTCIATHGRKRLRSALGDIVHKNIGGKNPALPQSFVLSSPAKEPRVIHMKENVLDTVRWNLNTNVQDVAAAVGPSLSTVPRILQKEGVHPYHLQPQHM
ncbi:hypothetical protein TNCV_4663481 [Trichonephila clavipes]|uniref:Uncharacterized protein n=1 Tax=Trichonephila clavipes TaxID=2585209 RepID=A0A8X6V8S3_TRICX|nr:hypothetical protein TNCV_4663481 [Trichonephila clavipes]